MDVVTEILRYSIVPVIILIVTKWFDRRNAKGAHDDEREDTEIAWARQLLKNELEASRQEVIGLRAEIELLHDDLVAIKQELAEWRAGLRTPPGYTLVKDQP